MLLLMPFKNFKATAAVLDSRLLVDQIQNAAEVIGAIREGRGSLWSMPDVQAWRFNVDAVRACLWALLDEHEHRFPELRQLQDHLRPLALDAFVPDVTLVPDWYSWAPYHDGHCGYLYRRDNTAYAQFRHHAEAPLLHPVLDDEGKCIGWAQSVRMAAGRAPRFRHFGNQFNTRTYPTAGDAVMGAK